MLQFQMKMKRMFFDSPAVVRRVDKRTRRVFSRFGAYVRQTARQSIRKPHRKLAPGEKLKRDRQGRYIGAKPRYSRQGDPPFDQTGLLKRYIYFGYDLRQRSVVIGPEKLTGPVSETAPHALEFGDESTTYGLHWEARKTVRKQGRKVTVRRVKTYRKVKIAARPYMRPAFAKELPKLSGLWQDSVSKAG